MVNKDKSESGGKLKEPVRLNSEHVISEFNSGDESLDHWLNYKALHNDCADASRAYVVCEDRHVEAYYCLSTGSVRPQ